MSKLIKSVAILSAMLSAGVYSSDSPSYQVNDEEKQLTIRTHSHNDYHLEDPFYGALKLGFGSFEADVFWDETFSEVLIAHDKWETALEWSFDEMYIQPIVEHVRANGHFYENWDYSVVLLVDIKTEAISTWLAVEDVLAQYPDVFTRYNHKIGVQQRPVTAIISGNRPIEEMREALNRYSFVDGRIEDVGVETDATLMPLISNNFSYFNQNDFGYFFGKGEWPEKAKEELKRVTDIAHANHQKIRFWATPEGIDHMNNHIWSELVEANVDFINTDHQQALHDWLLENDKNHATPGVDWRDHPNWN
ncbi:phosphatidylinositol-specific phospholipase C/glycerophosphodiester phosphodiesterase family protein [Vibrio lamellibrachiae]|uniref:phosphatidylinositol-specific phospholipase C/glycerophosphodiester phosphodiesterase family protein n=1 Tax=Vibrio lamellibrachiae TaxID=2910253 RepID=UPI003D14DEC5